MAVKRKSPASASAGNVQKRLRYVERQVRLNRPEMKHKTFSATSSIIAGTLATVDLTSIGQGTKINERIGDRIRVWRIEVRGLADGILDNYILQCHTTTAPEATDFGSQPGAFVLDSTTNTLFTEWMHYRNSNVDSTDDPQKYSVKFKNGIIVKYDGILATQCVDNRLFNCHLNRGASPHNVHCSYRVWFTDA